MYTQSLYIQSGSCILITITYLFCRIQQLYYSIKELIDKYFYSSIPRGSYNIIMDKIKKMKKLNNTIVERLCTLEKILNSGTLECLEERVKEYYDKFDILCRELEQKQVKNTKILNQHIKDVNIFKKEVRIKMTKIPLETTETDTQIQKTITLYGQLKPGAKI